MRQYSITAAGLVNASRCGVVDSSMTSFDPSFRNAELLDTEHEGAGIAINGCEA
jgi:hypothetical protein